jgi:hypothetical protein
LRSRGTWSTIGTVRAGRAWRSIGTIGTVRARWAGGPHGKRLPLIHFHTGFCDHAGHQIALRIMQTGEILPMQRTWRDSIANGIAGSEIHMSLE